MTIRLWTKFWAGSSSIRFQDTLARNLIFATVDRRILISRILGAHKSYVVLFFFFFFGVELGTYMQFIVDGHTA